MFVQRIRVYGIAVEFTTKSLKNNKMDSNRLAFEIGCVNHYRRAHLFESIIQRRCVHADRRETQTQTKEIKRKDRQAKSLQFLSIRLNLLCCISRLFQNVN